MLEGLSIGNNKTGDEAGEKGLGPLKGSNRTEKRKDSGREVRCLQAGEGVILFTFPHLPCTWMKGSYDLTELPQPPSPNTTQ